MINIILVKKRNKHILYYKIQDSVKTHLISTEITIQEKYWDRIKQKVRSNHPLSNSLNLYLISLKNDLYDSILEYTVEGKINISRVKKIVFSETKVDFFEFCKPIIERANAKGVLKSRNINYSVSRFKLFLKSDKINLNEIDIDLINRYENYLRIEKLYSRSTIQIEILFLKMVLKKAVEQNVLQHSKNPFLRYKSSINTEEQKTIYLTEAEINRILELKIPKNLKQSKIRDLFIFSCYCGGIRISDVLGMKKNNYDGHYISFTSNKNKQQHKIKVANKVKEILEKYSNSDSDYLFPILKYTTDEIELIVNKNRAINVINKSLKTIMKKAGIDKNISFHSSRRTFATNAHQKGIELKTISKIMGHSQIKQTLSYIKIEPYFLDEAMDRFNQ